jgi:hypothetical protein
LKKTQGPLVLTVNGKPALVVQTTESYQRLLDLAARHTRAKVFVKVWTMRRSEGPVQPEKSSPLSKQDVAYQVRLMQRAERDLHVLYDSVGAENFAAALKWYRGLKRAILSFERVRSDAL